MFQSTSIQEPSRAEQLAAQAELTLSMLGQEIGLDYSEVEARIVSDFRRWQERQEKHVLELVEEQAHLAEEAYLQEVA
jgi:competence CoiA-like predicted nuclease